jgi:N2-citryl-N6-acetyl-N6-hydroxylysine synthase
MLNTQQLAITHSAHCFFNSFLRDMNPPYDADSKSFTITLDQVQLSVPVAEFSALGVHRFSEQFRVTSKEGFWNINFFEAAELICSHFSATGKLFQRVLQSIEVMNASINACTQEIEKLYDGDINFLRAEQNLHIGHSFHPSPKSRDEFSIEDLSSFSPEFGASFKLAWLFVREELIWEERSKDFGQNSWFKELSSPKVPAGFKPYPMHPWQWEVLKRDPTIKSYLEAGSIIDSGLSQEEWSATSSMRSLYLSSSPFMLKFSMSVRLTNSIRHMQKKEVSRGMIVQDAFHTRAGLEFSKKHPQFKIMHEPLAFAIKDANGEVLPQTMVLLRENPFRDQLAEAAVLATLTQENPLGGPNLIKTCLDQGVTAVEWFEAFLETAIIPLLVAQADYGIMLGAHQQNLVIELKQGLPVGAYFRDCQGTGFSELAVERMLLEMPSKEKFLEQVLPQAAATELFTYYLIVNSVMNTISAVARASEQDESAFISIFKTQLLALQEEVRDASIITHLLSSSQLTQKGNFRCSAEDLNENTTTNPLSIYNSFNNPFFEASL